MTTIAPPEPRHAHQHDPPNETWVPVLIQPEALDTLADAIRDHLPVIQDAARYHALNDALHTIDRCRLNLAWRMPHHPDLQPRDSFPQRDPSLPSRLICGFPSRIPSDP